MDDNSDEEKYHVCNRKVGDGTCGERVPLVKANLRVFNAKKGLLSVVCPKCNKSQILGKVLSDSLLSEVNEGLPLNPDGGLVVMGGNTPDDDLTSLGDDGDGSAGDDSDSGDGSSAPAGELFKVEKLSSRVIRILNLFGYAEKKYKRQFVLIRDFVDTMPQYQSPQGLHNLLITVGGFDVRMVPMVVSRIFDSSDNQMSSQMNMMYGNMPGAMQPPVNQQWQNYGPTSSPPGPQIHTLPNGQVIIMPPFQQQPILAPAPAVRESRGDDGEIVEEYLGKEGQIVKRVVRGRKDRGGQGDSGTDIIKMLMTFKELGLIGNKGSGDSDTVIAAMAQRVDAQVNQIRQEIHGNHGPDPEVLELRRKLEEMEDERDKDREEQLTSVINDLKREMTAMRNDHSSRRERPTPDGSISDKQFELQTKSQTFDTMSSTVETLGAKIIEPLVEMNKGQARMNALLMVRSLEQQDGVNPGTYMSAINPPAPQSRDEIEIRKSDWKKRAAAVREDRVQQTAPAGEAAHTESQK